MNQLFLIILFSLTGIAFSLYKTRVRITKGGVLKREPERQHPVAHIKSILFLEVPIERIVLGYLGLLLAGYTSVWVFDIHLPALELALLLLSGIMVLLLLFNQILVTGISDSFRWRVLTLLVISTILTLLIWNRPGVLEADLLQQAGIYLLTLHLLGLVMGLGGALILDVMIFHFLNDLKISSREAVIMHLISQMIILGLILLIVSGVALTLANPDAYLESPRFLMKLTAVGVVTLNGVLLNLFIVPKMEQISFREGSAGENRGLIRGAFIAGAASMTSWLAVFLLAMINPLDHFGYGVLLGGYGVLLGGTVAGGLITKRLYENKG
jgi:hypothetical protein